MMRTLTLLITIFIAFSCSNSDTSFEYKTKLEDNWKIKSSKEITNSKESISMIDFNDSLWYTTKVPGTVLTSLIQNGVYKNVYKGDNLTKIPTEQFKDNWWYRKTFTVNDIVEDENIRLQFEGINYRANIWLNGSLIASSDSIESPFRIFDLDISKYVVEGKNSVAVEVFPPQKLDLTIGFVDWNPNAPDNNMGIWRGVYLKRSRGVSVTNTFIQTDLNDELTEALLNVSTEITNHQNKEVNTKLVVNIGEIKFFENLILPPNSTKLVEFTSEKYQELIFKNPRLWWPNNLGEANLYNCTISVLVENKESHEETVRFGIREVGQYVNDKGHKGYTVNGKRILIKGGGWVDDVMLADSEEKVEAQVKYAKHMNLNTIRLEGFWGNSKAIYEKADENGILLMLGWSCHWEWEGYCGRPEIEHMSITSEEDINLQAKAYGDQVVWLRNHPSIFLWVYGSDKLPLPELERKLDAYVKTADPTRPILASCKYHDFGTEHYNISEVSGPTGVKMLGPYGYVTPNYWYLDKNLGGAYGFNTETGPGPQVPPIESIKKMIPEENLWPIDEMWEFHLGRNEFQTLNRYLNAFNARYGEANSLEDFAYRSQISNYEAIRAMFESFAVNKPNATGIIQWMLNSAWPEMFWQLYDWYLMPNGAFYGTKAACQPLNLIYNYGDNNIYLSNEYNNNYTDLTAEITILDINSKILLSENVQVDIDAISSKMIFEIPSIKDLSTTYFIDLKLKSENEELSRNFYWLSTKQDVPDFKNSKWHLTPNKEYGDFKALNKMPQAQIKTQHTFETIGEDQILSLEIENTSEVIAFFVELKITKQKSKETVLPIFWDDNYISLLPGEKRTIKAKIAIKDLNGDTPIFEYNGLNIKQ
jgi:exo-1,4-beta-D-glucosaminidase